MTEIKTPGLSYNFDDTSLQYSWSDDPLTTSGSAITVTTTVPYWSTYNYKTVYMENPQTIPRFVPESDVVLGKGENESIKILCNLVKKTSNYMISGNDVKKIKKIGRFKTNSKNFDLFSVDKTGIFLNLGYKEATIVIGFSFNPDSIEILGRLMLAADMKKIRICIPTFKINKPYRKKIEKLAINLSRILFMECNQDFT